MVKPFKIYFKNGLIISLKIRRFQINEQNITLFDTDNYELDDLLLNLADISVIIPAELDVDDYSKYYCLFLKQVAEPLEIPAFKFHINESSEVEFFKRNYGGQPFKLKDVYICNSDVLTIIPKEDLEIIKLDN